MGKKSCSCGNVSLYEEGHRCIECFNEFVPKYQLNEAKSQLNYIRTEISTLILEHFNDYAPDEPPVVLSDFMDALEEVCRD